MASATEQMGRQLNWGAFGKAKDLKARLLFTLGALIVYRLGTHIPLPGIDSQIFSSIFAQKAGGILGMFDMFSGGAFQNMAIFALSIFPYITASIVFMFAGFASPAFQQLQKEGETGRRKIAQYTRYLTVLLAMIQGYGIAVGLERHFVGAENISAVINPGAFFRLTTVVTLVGGTMFLMWLGEQITARGIGNGISVMIFAGIVSSLPSAVTRTLALGREGALSPILILGMLLLAIGLVVFIVFMERAQRRILVQYPKRQVGQRMYSADSSHLPLKLNIAGVLPPIIAMALLSWPVTMMGFAGAGSSSGILDHMSRYLQHGNPVYVFLYGFLIAAFCFILGSMLFEQQAAAENLRKAGGVVPGLKPGNNTNQYLNFVRTRITVVGALYMVFVCLLPELLMSQYSLPFYLGGTGFMIAVTVPIETVSQVHSHLIAHQYEGLLNKRRTKGARKK